jgi:hypothetical protein
VSGVGISMGRYDVTFTIPRYLCTYIPLLTHQANILQVDSTPIPSRPVPLCWLGFTLSSVFK